MLEINNETLFPLFLNFGAWHVYKQEDKSGVGAVQVNQGPRKPGLDAELGLDAAPFRKLVSPIGLHVLCGPSGLDLALDSSHLPPSMPIPQSTEPLKD